MRMSMRMKQENSFTTPRNAALAAAKAKVERDEKDLEIYDVEEGKNDSDGGWRLLFVCFCCFCLSKDCWK